MLLFLFICYRAFHSWRFAVCNTCAGSEKFVISLIFLFCNTNKSSSHKLTLNCFGTDVFSSLTNVNVHMLILSSFELRHFRNINSFKVLKNQIQLFKMRFDFMKLSLHIAVFVFEHTVQRWFYQQIIEKCNSIIPDTIYRLHIAYRSIKSESQFILIKK